ncbi:hypothetical protein NP493_801g02063 [Ridgeia piscesae]|uniref:Protein kinase domain-containing protein n=1 Tax=Ridgeia piscesae TaxID=27915 RepID=A0AAD9KMT0_RIDPI|nr:hypothetical protein NP493_801g02063 [Ridgeia piscesae]
MHNKECARPSLFQSPKRLFPALVRTDPPAVHLTAYCTGGLQQLYKTVKTATHSSNKESYTDADGHFCPTPDMPLLAARYNFVQVIGKGQSAVLIKAQDTFRGGELVSVKILHRHYSVLGTQEADCIRRLNQADVHHFSGTLRLYTMFLYDGHYCLVFELLQPQPLYKYFLDTKAPQKLHRVRQVAVQLLSAVGFLQQHNVIHTDLKPDNLLLQTAGDCRSVKVIDFGNAIRCVHNELSLYYDDFELQTLVYRAPEVMLGVPFSMEIDLWSLGCVLTELYTGQPLFRGRDAKTVLWKMVQLLGPLPVDVFQRGKFFPDFHEFTANVTQPDGK